MGSRDEKNNFYVNNNNKVNKVKMQYKNIAYDWTRKTTQLARIHAFHMVGSLG